MYSVVCVTKRAAYLGEDPLVNEILNLIFLNSWLNKGLIPLFKFFYIFALFFLPIHQVYIKR